MQIASIVFISDKPYSKLPYDFYAISNKLVYSIVQQIYSKFQEQKSITIIIKNTMDKIDYLI